MFLSCRRFVCQQSLQASPVPWHCVCLVKSEREAEQAKLEKDFATKEGRARWRKGGLRRFLQIKRNHGGRLPKTPKTVPDMRCDVSSLPLLPSVSSFSSDFVQGREVGQVFFPAAAWSKCNHGREPHKDMIRKHTLPDGSVREGIIDECPVHVARLSSGLLVVGTKLSTRQSLV